MTKPVFIHRLQKIETTGRELVGIYNGIATTRDRGIVSKQQANRREGEEAHDLRVCGRKKSLGSARGFAESA
jgi:hypothetical protein